MLSAILISVFFIIFPLFFRVYVFYGREVNRLFFTITLFGVVKVLYGKIYVNSSGIVVDYNKKKRKIIRLNLCEIRKNGINKFSGYHLLEMRSLVEIGGVNAEKLFIITCVLNGVNNLLGDVFTSRKHYVQLDNNINVYLDKKVINVYLKLSLVINLLTLIVNLVKNFIRNKIYDKIS